MAENWEGFEITASPYCPPPAPNAIWSSFPMALGFSHSQMALSRSHGPLPCLSLPLPRFTAFPYSPWSVCSRPSGCGRMPVSCQPPGYLSGHDLWVPLPLCVLPGCPLVSPSAHTHACTHHTLMAASSFFRLTSQNPHGHMEIDPPHPQQHHPADDRQWVVTGRRGAALCLQWMEWHLVLGSFHLPLT